ncbi:MAG: glutamine-hydrolyzing carbamoyl-phosphate synthase small subunit [Betaproteobacteria bacterium]|nr:glutamine-hydrolyzing carbamoyl-phosphate synthase small subunit [Betaproteobacteria bacterium]
MSYQKCDPAILVLEDGTVFNGFSIGAEGSAVGEVVFNTSMTGYQEILTDPSYQNQIVTLTYPHIGSVGCNEEDFESNHARVAGLVIKDLPLLASNFRSTSSLSAWMGAQGIVGIAGIDTRKLTRLLREKGALSGVISTDGSGQDELLIRARTFPGLAGKDLAREVTCGKAYEWAQGEWSLKPERQEKVSSVRHVVAYDFGVKRNILNMLVSRGCRVTVVPASTSAEQVLAMKPDGVFLSNGPGDPEPCGYAIEAIKVLLNQKMPIFGICLGHQLLAIASGANTRKMKFGHHGANHPVKDLQTGQVLITSQNHGFEVDQSSLPSFVEATHISLFDGSLQGIQRSDLPAFSFQGHPEASPGPHDVAYLFDRFMNNIDQVKNN